MRWLNGLIDFLVPCLTHFDWASTVSVQMNVQLFPATLSFFNGTRVAFRLRLIFCLRLISFLGLSVVAMAQENLAPALTPPLTPVLTPAPDESVVPESDSVFVPPKPVLYELQATVPVPSWAPERGREPSVAFAGDQQAPIYYQLSSAITVESPLPERVIDRAYTGGSNSENEFSMQQGMPVDTLIAMAQQKDRMKDQMKDTNDAEIQAAQQMEEQMRKFKSSMEEGMARSSVQGESEVNPNQNQAIFKPSSLRDRTTSRNQSKDRFVRMDQVPGAENERKAGYQGSRLNEIRERHRMDSQGSMASFRDSRGFGSDQGSNAGNEKRFGTGRRMPYSTIAGQNRQLNATREEKAPRSRSVMATTLASPVTGRNAPGIRGGGDGSLTRLSAFRSASASRNGNTGMGGSPSVSKRPKPAKSTTSRKPSFSGDSFSVRRF